MSEDVETSGVSRGNEADDVVELDEEFEADDDEVDVDESAVDPESEARGFQFD